jgi:hypothetical protein
MRDAAAITALLVDVRNVAAHKSVRLEIHVPAEQAALVMAAFGWPTMVNPVPVAIARLNPEAQVTRQTEDPAPDAYVEQGVHRRLFADLSYSQQAGMRCAEPDFARFLAERHSEVFAIWSDSNGGGFGLGDEDAAASAVRFLCGVRSRSELRDGTDAGEYWKQLDAEYWAWLRGIR